MAMFKCKMCGGNLEVKEGMTVCECEYCGSIQTIPVLDDEKKINLFRRAHRLRSACEFDKAAGVYECIIAEFQEEAEAYWGLILCKYGIEYVDDSKTGNKVPTCHRSSFDSVLDDPNFEMVMEYSDSASRTVYRKEAKELERLRMRIIEVSSKEEPYDIFICYKETDALGERTVDSVIAQDVYDVLTEKGYRVFFSRITLEDKLGQEYEPYIFAALNSAKVMLVFGTDYEYYNAIWVKNEWNRFLNLIEKGEQKTLIPCFKGIDAYDIPKEFARLQAQDMGKIGAMQDLIRGIGKILGIKSSTRRDDFVSAVSVEPCALNQRGTMALEDRDFKGAERYFERVLDANPYDAYAYLGKFLAFYELTSLKDLDNKICNIEDSKEFRRAEQFADDKLANMLAMVKENNQKKIKRLLLIDVLNKHYKNKVPAYYQTMKKEAYYQLFVQSAKGEKRAKDIFEKLLNMGIISKREYSVLISKIEIIKGVRKILIDCEIHSKSGIEKEAPLHKYPSCDVKNVLQDLVGMGYIEIYEIGYCLTGAKEEKKRILKEIEERRQTEARQKAAYDMVCAQVESEIQSEAAPQIEMISEEFESQIREIQRKMNEVIKEADKKREVIQGEISDLHREQSSFGFFKRKEKKELQKKIDETQKRLDSVVSSQQIQSDFQPRIDKINREKLAAIDKAVKEIRAKYKMPKYEDFAEV